MPGIGWGCQCGKIFEEGNGFKWEFKCANLGCDEKANKHSNECSEKDWGDKNASLKAIVDKHIAVCNQASRCKKCSIPFSYKEEYRRISGSERAGTYHKSCWEKIKEEDNQPKCSDCGISFEGKPDSLYCDKCQRERERETKMTNRDSSILF